MSLTLSLLLLLLMVEIYTKEEYPACASFAKKSLYFFS
jgi:hypothetical protein